MNGTILDFLRFRPHLGGLVLLSAFFRSCFPLPILGHIVKRRWRDSITPPRKSLGGERSGCPPDDGGLDRVFVLPGMEQALDARPATDQFVRHSDRGTPYFSIRYTDRLADAGVEPSVGSVGDSYDNALADSVIGLYRSK